MKPGSIKNLRYSDIIAQRRERRRKALNFFISFLVLTGVGALGYWIFWSETFRINDVRVSGLNQVQVTDGVMAHVHQALSASLLSFIPTGNNILFFNPDPLRDRILNDFPEIRAVEVTRDFPHSVSVEIRERQAVGTWCFKGACRHFDDEGRAWGTVSRSSGSLLLIVDDYKHDSADFIGPSLLMPVRAAADGLERQAMGIRYLVIPESIFNDLWAVTNRGYTIYLNLEDSIEDQLAALKIFLADKEHDPAFHPQYLDLRIANRVYYK